jgi:hypothetical protein
MWSTDNILVHLMGTSGQVTVKSTIYQLMHEALSCNVRWYIHEFGTARKVKGEPDAKDAPRQDPTRLRAFPEIHVKIPDAASLN